MARAAACPAGPPRSGRAARLPARQLDFAEYFGRTRSQMKRVRSFRLPDGIVMWGRALTLLMGLASELAPGSRPLDVVGPYGMRFLAGGAPLDAPPARAAAGTE